MKTITAKKLNMTQVWTAEGKVVPVTVLKADEGQLADVAAGTVIHIKGRSKGRGTAGPVKRHGFHGAPASHGHDHPRAVGSIGHRFPQHTRPGMRMAGHMGSANATVKNSVVIAVDIANNLLTVKGGVPGHPEAKVKVQLTDDKEEIGTIVRYAKEEPVVAPTEEVKAEAPTEEVKAEEPKTEEPKPEAKV